VIYPREIFGFVERAIYGNRLRKYATAFQKVNMNIYEDTANRAKQVARSLGGEFFRPSVQLVKESDSFGNDLQTEIALVLTDARKIVERSNGLAKEYAADPSYGTDNRQQDDFANLSDILDFSEVIAFAESADGSPFCLDFRRTKNEPSVIWWDDDHWRYVAQSIDQFIELFEAKKNHQI
jgi:hypothetical protein